jgi:hypothetical protein
VLRKPLPVPCVSAFAGAAESAMEKRPLATTRATAAATAPIAVRRDLRAPWGLGTGDMSSS